MLREVAEPSHKDCVRFVRTRIGVKVRHQLPPQIKSNARIGRIFRRRIENIRYPMNCAPWSFRASSGVAPAQRNAMRWCRVGAVGISSPPTTDEAGFVRVPYATGRGGCSGAPLACQLGVYARYLFATSWRFTPRFGPVQNTDGVPATATPPRKHGLFINIAATFDVSLTQLDTRIPGTPNTNAGFYSCFDSADRYGYVGLAVCVCGRDTDSLARC